MSGTNRPSSCAATGLRGPIDLRSTGQGLVLAGTFAGRLNAGKTTIESHGCEDGYVARYDW